MHVLLALLLLVAGPAGTPSAAKAPGPQDPAPLAAVAYGDCLDFLLLLQDPAVTSEVLDVVEHEGLCLAAVLHEGTDAEGEACTWIGFYTFPSSIFAHSVVSVPLHAEEMD